MAVNPVANSSAVPAPIERWLQPLPKLTTRNCAAPIIRAKELHDLLADFGFVPHLIDVHASRWRKDLRQVVYFASSEAQMISLSLRM
jgi:hypothetical protein